MYLSCLWKYFYNACISNIFEVVSSESQASQKSLQASPASHLQ